jgi:3-hydroxyisobutyrate dehydrogenase
MAMSDAVQPVGLIGVGRLGGQLLERMILIGMQVVAHDVDPAARQRAADLGASLADCSAAVAAQAPVVHVVVLSEHDVLDCSLGADGLLLGARPGGLWLLHSTVSPEATRRVAAAAAERGVQVVDAPVAAGGARNVREGRFSFLLGCEPEASDRARAHLRQLADRVIRMGPLGTGNVAKLMRNFVIHAQRLVLHEVLQAGERTGIRPRSALEMMRLSHTNDSIEDWEEDFTLQDGCARPRVGGAGGIFLKDQTLFVELGRQLGLRLPIAEQLLASTRDLAEPRTGGEPPRIAGMPG